MEVCHTSNGCILNNFTGPFTLLQGPSYTASEAADRDSLLLTDLPGYSQAMVALKKKANEET